MLLWEIVPRKVGFDAINKVMDKKQLGDLIDICYRLCGEKETVLLADRVRIARATPTPPAPASRSRIKDMVIPQGRRSSSSTRQKEVREIENQYLEGLITDGERYNKVIDIWAQVTEEIAERDDERDLAGRDQR